MITSARHARPALRTLSRWAVGLALFGAGASAWTGCGSSPDTGSDFGTGDGGAGASGAGASGAGASGAGASGAGASGGDPGFADACANLSCRQKTCAGGMTTTLTGTVYDPAGKTPLYNAVVYVPNGEVEAFPEGVSCDRCGAGRTGAPLVTALSGPDGKFVLENVPVGADVPLVIQIGKFRRKVTIPKVPECTTTALDPALTRLPRKQGEGSPADTIPHMAIASGSADPVECLLLKMGIDPSEFTAPSGKGRIHFYKETGLDIVGGAPPASTLWSDLATLKKYDFVYLACEGEPHPKPAAATSNVMEYTKLGGRVFATHYDYEWIALAQDPFRTTGKWSPSVEAVQAGKSIADAETNWGYLDKITANVDVSFPKGQAFAQWLSNVGASPKPRELVIEQGRHDLIDAVGQSRQWIDLSAKQPAYDPKNPGKLYHSVQHMTFNTPVGVPEAQQCGRVVYSDFHVSADARLPAPPAAPDPKRPFPGACKTGDLSATEKAIEFMLFDLSSCVQSDSVVPTPPH